MREASRPAPNGPADGKETPGRDPMVDWEAFYNRFREPDFVAGYEIQNRLGGGAFGEVYKARKSSIGKSYAIKFLKLDEASNQAAIERELEQVRLFASIDHPNLVTIEDMGLVAGVPFLIMGYAGEETLARRMKRRDLDRESGLVIFTQVCRGVLALHDRRLAHFDLKPANVFIKGDVARVGDYGLAKLLTEGRQTLSFGRGTPHYMAPEMMRNRADHRADLYSLGVILYETLCFELPYSPETQGGILRETDEPPTFPDEFPAALRAPVERCLRLEPDDRFDTVNELLESIGQTSRQGDSITIPWDAEAPARPAPAATVREAPDTPTTTDLREAAAELARGAASVARGVWEGVSSRRDPARDDTPEDAAAAGGGEVVSLKSLQDPDEPRPDPPARPAWLVAAARPNPAPLVTAASASTVPVPPRAEGGVAGTVLATVVLGAEILGAIVTGPVLVVLRTCGRALDRVFRGVPGVLGSILRFAFVLLLLACLGAVVAVLVLAPGWFG